MLPPAKAEKVIYEEEIKDIINGQISNEFVKGKDDQVKEEINEIEQGESDLELGDKVEEINPRFLWPKSLLENEEQKQQLQSEFFMY